MPAQTESKKWFFSIAFLLLIVVVRNCWPQTPDPLPPGVQVQLVPKDGRTSYLMGEPIYFTLRFSAERPGFMVNRSRIFGVSEGITVTPAEDIFRWNGMTYTDAIELEKLTARGFSMSVWLNDAIILKKPGTYTVSVTTRRLAAGTRSSDLHWLTITTNSVVIRVAPMPEQEEATRVAELSAAIAKTDDSIGLDHTFEVPLACLEGDVAAQKKVSLFLTGHDDITALRATGLALSRNKKLELKLLDAAWRSLDKVPDQRLLNEMIVLRRLDEGIPLRDIPGYPSKGDIAGELSERSEYLDEIAATLSRRDGANRAETLKVLESEKQYENSLLNTSK